jgi:chromosome partitioning protein
MGGQRVNTIVFASRKGGAGKSTLAVHLAAHVAKPSTPTLLIDADPQGSSSLWHGLREKEHPTLKRVSSGVAETVKWAKKEGYHWVFIDTPPNTSNAVVDAIGLATLVVIPTRASVFDVAAVTDTIDICRRLRKPYAVVINAAPSKRNDVEPSIVGDARAGLTGIKAPVWSGQITHRSDLCFALGAGAGVREFVPGSPAAIELGDLWKAIDRSVTAINGAYRTAREGHRAAA